MPQKPERTRWVELMLWVYDKLGRVRFYLFKNYVVKYRSGIIIGDPLYMEDEHEKMIRAASKYDHISVKDTQL
jgi:hypothetical protein